MIINKSLRYFYPLMKNYINFTYEPMNSYMFHSSNLDLFTLTYIYDDKLIKNGYESFGFLKFDNYMISHRLLYDYIDSKEFVNYVLKIPKELIPAKYKIIRGDYMDLYNDEKKVINVKCNELNRTIYELKSYETFYG